MFKKKVHLKLKLEQAERNHLRNKLYLGGGARAMHSLNP